MENQIKDSEAYIEDEGTISIEDFAEDAEFIEDAESIDEEECIELSDEDMSQLAGGVGLSNNRNDKKHYRGNFIKKHVHGVVHYDGASELTIRKTPGGTPYYGAGWQNNQIILVNRYKSTWRGKWAWCFSTKKGGVFGYVDSKYFS